MNEKTAEDPVDKRLQRLSQQASITNLLLLAILIALLLIVFGAVAVEIKFDDGSGIRT
jgi:hypothetical protein